MVCSLGMRTLKPTHTVGSCRLVTENAALCFGLFLHRAFYFIFLLFENHTCIRVFLLSRKVRLPLLTFLPNTLYASPSI